MSEHTSRLGRTLEWLVTTICLLLGGLVLMIWPGLLIACAMGGDSFNSHTPKMAILALTLVFMGVLCYPGVYIACLVTSITMLLRRPSRNVFYLRATIYASLPVLYLVAVFAILVLCGFLAGV